MSKSKPDEDILHDEDIPELDGLVFHRGVGKKHEEENCWCSPLQLTPEQRAAHNARSMDELLDQFYQVH